jgi:hypothetical protein
MVALLGLLGATGLRAQETVGSVAALEGSAEAIHAGQPDRNPLKAADPVLLNDHMFTGEASKLKLLFRDDSVLTLAANSELTVDQQVVGPASATAAHSVIGTVRAVVTDRYKTAGSTFEVETPTAIAGVRGTAFIVRYEPRTRITLVAGLSGTVCVRAKLTRGTSPDECLEPKEFTEVKPGKAPSQAAPLDARVLQILLEATEIPGGGIDPEREIEPQGGLKPGQRPPFPSPEVTERERLAEPTHPEDPAFPPEGRVIDQPIPEIEKKMQQPTEPTPPPPPPPPPPPGGRSNPSPAGQPGLKGR